eukprot:5237806-Pyramimonas_sp.AAC.1
MQTLFSPHTAAQLSACHVKTRTTPVAHRGELAKPPTSSCSSVSCSMRGMRLDVSKSRTRVGNAMNRGKNVTSASSVFDIPTVTNLDHLKDENFCGEDGTVLKRPPPLGMD